MPGVTGTGSLIREVGRRSNMKRSFHHSALLLLLLPALSGCMTRSVCGKARMDSDGIPQDRAVRPGYYALVPLTVVGDVVTFPIQAGCHFAYEGHEGDP
jgi:hypothetical protein